MAEIFDNIAYHPNLDKAMFKLGEMLYDRAVPTIATEALSAIMSSWDNETGYSFDGSPFPWQRSPESTRTNPILFDTGTLKSSISIVYTKDSTPFYFEASGKTYDNGNSVEDVSAYNSYNPHDNVPIEYQAKGKEFQRILNAERELIIDDLVADGTIVYL